MPRKPRFIHPVRQVRTCLGHTQPSFAKLIGCSASAVQQIENGNRTLSPKLATSIMEATGADPVSLRAGREAKAFDMVGCEFSKESYEFYIHTLPCDGSEVRTLLLNIFDKLQLLFIASNRGGKHKTYAVNFALQRAVNQFAKDFNLIDSIRDYLIKNGEVEKRIYRVSDLRKFTEYARILGFKDNKRYKTDKLITFNRPRGWFRNYFLHEKPVLPPGADLKLRDAKYIIDDERFIPDVIKEAIAQALYWEIKEFRVDWSEKPVR